MQKIYSRVVKNRNFFLYFRVRGKSQHSDLPSLFIGSPPPGGYKVVCCYDDKYSKPIQTYRGENIVYKFMEKMLEEVEYCKAVVKKRFNKPLVMTENDEMCFKLMDKCHICGEKYTDKDVLVRDHCHITGKFRGSAHQECNLTLKIKPEDIKIPVIFHNLRGYDSHFIMQQVGKIAKNYAYKDKKEKSNLWKSTLFLTIWKSIWPLC